MNKKTFQFFLLVFFICCCTFAHSKDTPINYNLHIKPYKPDIGIFSADTSSLNTLIVLQPRNNSTNSPTQISCINGETKTLISYGDTNQCERIEWRVTFHSIGDLDIDVSEQRNLYSEKGWWVLFEWGVLPGLTGVSEVNICINPADSTDKTDCRSLPEPDQPPLIMIWGKPDFEEQVSGNNFRIYTDLNGRPLVGGNAREQLSSQYSYLSSLFPAEDAYIRTINIAWIGIDRKWQVTGGAAGKNAYIANYTTDNNIIDQASRERLIWVCGHETFHMLAPYTYPLWISESLAHYYGYKSLTKSVQTSLEPTQEWKRLKVHIPVSGTGLYEAHKKVIIDKDRNYYGLFYNKGAAFWQDLDTLLADRGHSLDQYLPLLSDSQEISGKLGHEFVETVTTVIGEQAFNQLVSQYL